MHEVLNRYLGTDRLSFMAIDGSCQKQQFSVHHLFWCNLWVKRFLSGMGRNTGFITTVVASAGCFNGSMGSNSLCQYGGCGSPEEIPFWSQKKKKSGFASIHVQLMQLANAACNTVQSSKLDARI